MTNPLAGICQIISDPLDQVRRLLAEQIALPDPELQELADHIRRYQGKMLRPVLLLLSGQAVGRIGPEHINLATVVELLHQATLVHDDVLDGAQLRRKLPTVSRLWGNETSVLLGDYLLSQAFNLCNATGDLAASKEISSTAGGICRGELLQCLRRQEWQIGETEYLRIIDLKTASLYRLCCHLGGHLAEASEKQLDALAEYGRLLGCAFQIADDLIDLLGEEELAGKSLGSDLAQGKPTLPIIHCIQQADHQMNVRLLELLGSCAKAQTDLDRSQIDEILTLLQQTGSIEYTRTKALELADRAKDQLDLLPAGQARDAMSAVADFVVERSC